MSRDSKTVFIRSSNTEAIKLTDVLTDLSPKERKELQLAGDELSKTGQIQAVRAGLLANGDWSVWTEDELGSRRNFVIYVSALETGSEPVKAQDSAGQLGVYIERGHAQSSREEFIEASEYISSKFTGELRRKLLDSLYRALAKKSSFDGSIEWTTDGVILRASSADTQVRTFDAELKLIWK